MQRLDDLKRQAILCAAAELFAIRPYDEVRLDEIADHARVGKGTVYLYFKSKEELYGAIVLDGFSRLEEELRQSISDTQESSWAALCRMVEKLVAWAYSSPHVFQLMKTGDRGTSRAELKEKRGELGRLFELTIRRGVASGELSDPRPDLTAQFIPSCVRGALRHGPENISETELASHIIQVIGGGILVRGEKE